MATGKSAWRRVMDYFDAKRVSVLIGAVLSIVGSAGQFFFIETLTSANAKLESATNASLARIEVLKAAQLQYFFTYQQGSILFALDPNGTTRDKQVLAGLYKLNVINRATPLSSMLGELALSGAVPFRETLDRYNTLNDAARADFSWTNYVALNEFEKDVIDRALAQQHKLQEKVLEMQALKAQIDDESARRKLMLVLVTLVGSGFLLVANLLTTRKAEG